MNRVGLLIAYTVGCLLLIPATIISLIVLFVVFVGNNDERLVSLAIIAGTTAAWWVAYLLQRALHKAKAAAKQAPGFPVVIPGHIDPVPAAPVDPPVEKRSRVESTKRWLLGLAIGVSLAWVALCTGVVALAAIGQPHRIQQRLPEFAMILAASLPGWAVLVFTVRILKRLGRVYEEPGIGFTVLPRKEDP